MIRFKFKIIIFFVLTGILPLSAQILSLRDTVRYSVTLGGLYTSGRYAPFWLQSLNYGKVYHTPTTAFGSLAVYKDYGHKQRIVDYGFGAEFLSRTDAEINGIYVPIKKEFYFHELYFKARFMSLQLIAGAKEEIIGTQDSTLSAGGIIFSKNARPIPKITLGFPEYVPIPSTNNKILLKSRISHGWVLDEYHPKVMLHHKNLYFKIVGSDYPWWVEGGLEHFAMWGGIHKGNISLVNFIKIFFGKQGGSDASTGDQINAFGAHVLSQSIKAGFQWGDYTINSYWQNLSEDGPMRFFWAAMNKEDGLFGLSIKNKKAKVVNGFLYELLSTVDQSGPFHDKDGMIYGGVDNYFGGGQSRWFFHERTIGIPLIHSPVYIDGKRQYNNALIAHHLGISGDLNIINYRAFVSYSQNYGSAKSTTYKSNTSLLFDLHRYWGGGFETGLSLGADIGKMYGNNYGAMLTIKKSGNLFRMRAPRVVVNPLW